MIEYLNISRINGYNEKKTKEYRMFVYEYEIGYTIFKLAQLCGIPYTREYGGRGENECGSYPVNSYFIEVESSEDFAKKLKESDMFKKTPLDYLTDEIDYCRWDGE